MKTEVAIIGGGIVGCAAAYYLAKRGMRVIVLEKDLAVGLQASGRNAGGVRQHGRKAALPLAMEAVKWWSGLADELRRDIEYIRTGNLKIALDEARAALLEEEAAWEREQGLAEVRMLTPEECHELIPGIAERVYAGKLCPTDGVANPMLVTPAYACAAQKLSAEIRTRTVVTGLLRQGSTISGVITDRGEIEAQVVVNAAGPWAAKISNMAGCVTPIEPRRSQLLVTERLPHHFTPWLYVHDYGYLRQTTSGNIIIGIGGKPTDGYSTHVYYPHVTLQAARMISALPWLGEVSLLRTFAGITEFTSDEEPYIGTVPGVSGFYIAAGFHGQGFCVGPMAARIIAEIIDGGNSPVSLKPFRPDRFASVQDHVN